MDISGGRGARLGGAVDHRRRETRGARGDEGGLGRACSRLGGLGERRKLPHRSPGWSPAANDFGTLWAYKTTLVALKYLIQVVNF